MHIVEKPQMLRTFAPNVSTEVETLVHQMLEKKPPDRPSMRQVLTGLEQLGHSSTASGLTGQQVIVVAPPELPPPPAKKNTGILVIGGLLVVAIGVGVVAVTQRGPVPVAPTVPVVQPQPPPKVPEAPPGPNASIVVESEPAGAQVLGVPDGKPLGTTPWRLQRDRQAGKLEVVVRQAGYADQKLVFDGQSDDTRLVKLVASSPQGPAANPTSAEIAKKNALVRKPLVQPQKPGKPLGKPAEKNRDDDIDIAIKR